MKFHVPGAGTAYIDLSSVYIKTRVRIVTEDGSPLPERTSKKKKTSTPVDAAAAAEEAETETEGSWSVGVVNNLAHALWDQVEVRLNDRVVTGGQTGYSYKALINTLLGEVRQRDNRHLLGRSVGVARNTKTQASCGSTELMGPRQPAPGAC